MVPPVTEPPRAVSISPTSSIGTYHLVVVLATMLGLCGCGQKGNPPIGERTDVPSLVRKVRPSVVLVTCFNSSSDTLCTGSGFFMSDNGYVVTNRHVVAGVYRAEIRTTDGRTYDVKGAVAEDSLWDVVVLATTASLKEGQYLKLAKGMPDIGSRVLVVGCPLGLEQTVTDGIVSALQEVPGLGRMIQLTAPISPGSSGSPVVNADGEVLGIATFYLQGGQNLNFAVPSNTVEALSVGEPKPLSKSLVNPASRFPLDAFLDRTESEIPAVDAWMLGLRCLWSQYYLPAAKAFEVAAQGDTLPGVAEMMAGCAWFMLDSLDRAIYTGQTEKSEDKSVPDAQKYYMWLDMGEMDASAILMLTAQAKRYFPKLCVEYDPMI